MSDKKYWPSDNNKFLVVFQPDGSQSRMDEKQWAFPSLESAQKKAREVGGSIWAAWGKGWIPHI
jgi:FAD/FMN-containing dehydrogenase